MKKVYESPKMVVEQFEANEYIAACGDSGVAYYFKCNAGNKGTGYNVYLKNGTPYATSGNDKNNGSPAIKELGGYSPCGEEHTADSQSGFLEGYMYARDFWSGNNYGQKIDVIIWTENYTNVHCTTDLDMKTWETAKS